MHAQAGAGRPRSVSCGPVFGSVPAMRHPPHRFEPHPVECDTRPRGGWSSSQHEWASRGSHWRSRASDGCSDRPDPRSGGGQFEPLRRQRRAAFDRTVLRFVANDAESNRGGVLARARGVRPLPGCARRPVRAEADARSRNCTRDPDVAARCLGTLRRGAFRRTSRRRSGRGHGLPDHARTDHGALVRRVAHEGDRPLVGPRRRDRRARARLSPVVCSSSTTGNQSSW